jgi:hypothetical protein
MFKGCTSLLDAAEMHLTSTGDQCFMDMYQGCSSLSGLGGMTLPAEVVAPSAYLEMFINCTSLVQTPVINASVLCSNAMACTF